MAKITEHLLETMAYTEWANRAVLDAVREASGRVDVAPMLDQLGHLLRAQLIWLDRVEGLPPRLDVWGADTPEACAGYLEAGARGWTEALRRRSPEETVAYANSKGRRFVNTVAEIAAHVVNHGTHHRSQVVRMLRRAGVEPPQTDLIFYLRDHRPRGRETG